MSCETFSFPASTIHDPDFRGFICHKPSLRAWPTERPSFTVVAIATTRGRPALAVTREGVETDTGRGARARDDNRMVLREITVTTVGIVAEPLDHPSRIGVVLESALGSNWLNKIGRVNKTLFSITAAALPDTIRSRIRCVGCEAEVSWVHFLSDTLSRSLNSLSITRLIHATI